MAFDDLDLPASALSFDEAMDWLEARVGQEVVVSVSSGLGVRGMSGAELHGVLGPGSGEVQLIDPRPGRVALWSVGEASLQLLEGDFVEAEVVDEAALALDLGELQLFVALQEPTVEHDASLSAAQLSLMVDVAARDAGLRRLAMLCVARLGLDATADPVALVEYIAEVGDDEVPSVWPDGVVPDGDGLWLTVVDPDRRVVRLVDVQGGRYRSLRFDHLGRVHAEGSGARAR